MQPYFFPYLGYFQLLEASDIFVFYDDVNFINRGWINRNRILINEKATYITVPLSGASQNKKINEIGIEQNAKWRKKLMRSIEMAYRKAPYFDQVYPLLCEVLEFDTGHISSLAIHSVQKICNYLQLNRKFEISSLSYPQTVEMGRAERIIEISKLARAYSYVNAPGGQELYEESDFLKNGIQLRFLHTDEINYQQFSNVFIPNLSVIDAIMFNPRSSVLSFLNSYKLL